MQLKGPTPRPVTIELNGMFGSFHVGQSALRIKYVSTFANPTNKEQGHAQLVNELKPMRERLDASQITDLKSLLQRDLNDRRVARELIPYLRGAGTQGIGFFPAILAVLVPRGYLADKSIDYPQPTYDPSQPEVVRYGSAWTVERYQVDTTKLPLGVLKIAPSEAEIIVLDGQHRANAFRYVAGDFDQSEKIYQAFYDEVGSDPSEGLPFDADLPVTLIWFEAPEGAKIEPDLISRKLFVDVNNSAKRVSISRTILLDDRAATCIGTTEFYNLAAQGGFKPNVFSLLHGAFDMDSDISQGRTHRFMLTTPELINTTLSWAFFGGSGNDNLGEPKASREVFKNKARFARIFPDVANISGAADDDEEPYRRLFFELPSQAEAFRTVVAQTYLPVLLALFNQFSFLSPHYLACSETEDWVMRRDGSTTQRETWQKVFCGGEGLYWSLQKVKSQRAQSYQMAMREIEDHFTKERARLLGTTVSDANLAYDSFLSKAFQSGYVGAVEYLARHNTDWDYAAAADLLVDRLSEYSNTEWAVVFKRLRPAYFGGVDPKMWQPYRNLLIRMFDGQLGQLYNESNRDISPDWIIFKEALNRAAYAYGQTAESMPDDLELRRSAAKTLAETEILLTECGLVGARWFDHDDVLGEGFGYLRSRVAETMTLFGL